MDSPWLAFLELFVVLGFGLGWAVLELLQLRRDKRRSEESEHAAGRDEPPA